MSALNADKKESFFYENFIAPGAKVWVRGGYVYAGITLLFFSFGVLCTGSILSLITDKIYQPFYYMVVGSALIILFLLGIGSFKVRQWAVLGWVGVSAALLTGLFSISYGYELWPFALFSVVLAAVGLRYYATLSKSNGIGMALGALVVVSAFVLVAGFSRPEIFGGPNSNAREEALNSFFSPESFLKTDKGKTIVMEMYGYSTNDIIFGTTTDDQVLEKVKDDPAVFNSYVYSSTHSFWGYVDSVFFALFGSTI